MSAASQGQDGRPSHVFDLKSGARQYFRPEPEPSDAQAAVEPTPGQQVTETVQQPPSRPLKAMSKASAATSRRSAASVARQLELELEAAEAKAKIDKELIDKRLAVAKAELSFAQYAAGASVASSRHTESLASERIQKKVQSWMDYDCEKQPIPQHAAPKPTTGGGAGQPLRGTHRAHFSPPPDISTAERLLSRLATPRDLPVFGGDCVEWLHFKCAYEESSQICHYTDSENLWRLRKALRGDAKEAVTDLLIGNTPPAVVMEALELRFGRSEQIVQKIAAQLRKLNPLPSSYQNELFNFSVKVNNSVATIRALRQDDYLRSPELVSAVASKLPSTLLSKWTEYAYSNLTSQSKLELLGDFLKKEAQMLSIIGVSLASPAETKKTTDTTSVKRQTEDNKVRNKSVFATTTVEQTDKCRFCKTSPHLLTECRTFKRAMRKDKWRFVKAQKLCYSCLIARHNKSECTAPVCDIDNCGMAHHKLLHWKKPTTEEQPEKQPREEPEADSNPDPEQPSAGTAAATATVAHVAPAGGDVTARPVRAIPTQEVMLKVISVQLRGPKGVINTYALLDDAASVSMIDSNLADTLGLKCEGASDIKLVDAFGIEVFQSAAPSVSAQISGQGNELYDIKLRKVSQLKLPMQNLSVINEIDCDYLGQIKDGVCKERVCPRILIGEDNYFLIAPLELIHGNRNAPYATRCRLGWSVHGPCARTHPPRAEPSVSDQVYLTSVCVTDNDDASLDAIIKHSFQLDSIGISTVGRENTAHSRAVQILDETARHIGTQWEVGLPFKSDNFTMPSSYDAALNRQKLLLKRFDQDHDLKCKYTSQIENLFSQGYARPLSEREIESKTERVWYLPHFGVYNPNKGKLRLVYDAAAKVKGYCLNDFLPTGPDLYNSLLGIMFRFRENPIAITGDIKDMFLRIKIRPEDQHVLRFLWSTDSNVPPTVWVMDSLIFGATCSPFIAQYIKNKNAQKYEDQYPAAVDVIVNNHYMDDCVHSTKSADLAIKLVNEITEIHKQGGFHIRGWSSNSKQVLDSIPTEIIAPTAISFKDGSNSGLVQRTLGLLWNPAEDTFGFQVSLDRIPPDILRGEVSPTKAKMLAIIMSVYDIHGFLAPFMIKSKMLLQNVHRSGVDWKEQIRTEEQVQWKKWLDELKETSSLRIPRWYGEAGNWSPCYFAPLPPLPSSVPLQASTDEENPIVDTQMHTFCDASIKAYAACVYWRFTRKDGSVNVCLVAGKSRVSQLAPISVPRLELQGALVGARLADTVQKEHRDIRPQSRFFWTDSSTVLQWIRSDPRTFKPYVAFRLGEIDELTKLTEWRHVPTRHNVADVATKSDTPPLKWDDMWFNGPAFLRRPEEEWPKDLRNPKTTEEAACETKTVLVVSDKTVEFPVPNEDNFSSWTRLVRVTARVLFFIRRCQRKVVHFGVELLKEAEDLLIKKSQQDSFASEIASVSKKQPLPNGSRLTSLTPYLDDQGIIRVEGRIDKVVGIDQCTSRPVILDGRHRTARLLVEYYHRRALHGANEMVVNELRQKYWVLNLRPTVRGVAARCLFCHYRRAKPQPQRMADLPSARLQHNRRPFTFSGVDFFGPMEVTVGRRRLKRYGMIFTCLTTRAIHIELTETISTDSTIMALRRMIARRGAPSVIYSDNGTNLRGADNELKKSLQELNADKLQEDGTVRGIEWRFIPPGAPEMGGAWERMIRTVKTALKVVLNERAPYPEILSTLLAEVEALVNSRPITHVSTDPNYPEALTPNHFLIGTSSNGSTFGKYDKFDLSIVRRQWRAAQRLTDMFWTRWLKEYLPTLLPRQKWNKEVRPLQVGDYVVIVEPSAELGSWRHGVVSAALAGSDGRVRVVDVRTRTGLLRRPATRVALLTPSSSADSTGNDV